MAGVGVFIALLAPATVEAAPAINIQVLVGDACVSGTGGANKHVSATLRTSGGTKRDAFTTASDSTGLWQGCFSLFLPTTTINGGDVLNVTVGSTSRTLTIPRLTPTIDRVANTISGQTAANTSVSVFVTHHPNFKKSHDFTFSAVSDGAGRWMVDTTGTVNLIGEDEVTAITVSGGDAFGAITAVPYMLVSAVNNTVEGVANVGTPVTFTLVDSHGAPKGAGDGGNAPFGSYTAGLFDSHGDPAYPIGGDRLESNLASDASVRLPSGQLRANAATDTVFGKCMPNSPYFLATANRAYAGRTGPNGRFSRNVGSKENVKRGDQLHLACMYPTGDVWVRTGIAS